MNTFKYILLLTAGVLLLASCKENTFVSDIENGQNLAAFTENSKTVSNVADGKEYPVEVRMKVEGPSVRELSGDITVTVEPAYESPGDTIPENQRAVAGTHFRLGQNQITLKESNNYLGTFTVTMLTEGISAPNAARFKLKATEASGSGNVINSGKPIGITLSYACNSNLQGKYDVSITREDGNTYNHAGVTITKTGIGQYVGETIGGFRAGGSPYRPQDIGEGIEFSDVCGTLSIPTQDLNAYSNEVGQVAETKVDGNSQTGELTGFTLKYYVTFGGEKLGYTAVYTKI